MSGELFAFTDQRTGQQCYWKGEADLVIDKLRSALAHIAIDEKLSLETIRKKALRIYEETSFVDED